MAIWVGQDETWNDDDGDGAALLDEPIFAESFVEVPVFEEFYAPGVFIEEDFWRRSPHLEHDHHEHEHEHGHPMHHGSAHPSVPHPHPSAPAAHHAAPSSPVHALPMQHPQSPTKPAHPVQQHTSGEFTGWTEPFTDWEGELLDGPGQYYVWQVTDPWEPASHEASDVPPAGVVAPNSVESLSYGETAAPYPPPDPLYQGPPLGAWRPQSDGGGGGAPPPPRTIPRAPRGAGGGGGGPRAPRMMASGAFSTGWDYPLTDDDGHLLLDPHPSFEDYDVPMDYGDPVLTGWETPLTDRYGQLLSGPGQYGTFTMEDPYDHHRGFDNVGLTRFDLQNQPFYFYTGADDTDWGASLGQAFGSALGSGTGQDAQGWGQAGKDIGMAIESGSDSGDWGAALASIGSAAAKVAVPAIAKAAQGGGGGASTTTTTSQPSTTQPAQHAQQRTQPRRKGAAGAQRQKLLVYLAQLADKYGIDHGRQPSQ